MTTTTDGTGTADPTTAEPGWTVLAARGARPRRTGRVPRRRTVLLQCAAAAAVVVALVGAGGALAARHTAESEAVHDVARLTDVLAESVVQPALTDAMPADPAVARRGLDHLVRDRVLSDQLLRVKLWAPNGRIVYSDDARLAGRRFPLDADARAALTHPQTRAEVSDLTAPENRYERGNGTLLEVYRPVWTPSGRPLLFETYFRYDEVRDRAAQLWRGFGGITLSSLAALIVLLVPVIWAVLARARRADAQREQMLRRATDASLDERRRIAAALHDGVVQELAAASFAVAGSAQEAAARGEPALAGQLAAAGEAVRSGIGSMRSLLVDIYPPSLHRAGLVAALQDLAAGQRGRTPAVVLDLDPHAADGCAAEEIEAVFRIAQECVRNAARHSGAATVHLTLRGGRAVVLTVSDDGAGFDPGAARPSGHFGVAAMIDLAHGVGAELAVRSAPGAGTTWQLTLAAR